MANRTGKGTFKKGDKRINRRGRPKDHVSLRKLIQRIAWEPDGKDELPRLELMIAGMFTSKNPADHESLLKHGYGDVPKEIELSGNKNRPLVIEYVNDWRGTTDTTAGTASGPDSGAEAGAAVQLAIGGETLAENIGGDGPSG